MDLLRSPDVLFEPDEQNEGRSPDAATAGQSRAGRSGAEFKDIAVEWLRGLGGRVERLDFELDCYPVDAEVCGANGHHFLVLARGTPDNGTQAGLRRTDTIEKLGSRAWQIRKRSDLPLLVLTSDLPTTPKPQIYLADQAELYWDVVAWRGDLRGCQRLHSALSDRVQTCSPDAPWRHRPGRHEQAPELPF